jgi:probable phosphoglycerate mutase
MLLYIIRHGDPNYSTDSLTPKGVLQAEAVGKRLAASGIDRIFSSPMGRAKQTAEPACRLLGLDYTIEEWTHEIGREMFATNPDGKFVSMGGIPSYCFLENGGINLPFEKELEAPVLNETQMDTVFPYIEENGKNFLERLGYKEENGVYRILNPNDDRVALFCHAGFARAWISRLLHIPAHIMWAGFNYCHTGVTILDFKNYPSGFTAPRMLCYADMSHYHKEGLPPLYNNHTIV